MTKNFIAIAQDGYGDAGEKLAAQEIVIARLKNEIWPIYWRSKNRAVIEHGDSLFFYVGGRGPAGGRIVASARVAGLHKPTRNSSTVSLSADVIDKQISLHEIRFFPPFPLKPVLIEQGVIEASNSKWGAFLMGGFSKISESLADSLRAKIQ